MNSSITAIVLAAGKGSRMGTALPKVVHPVAGKPMIARILSALKELSLKEIRLVIKKDGNQFVQPIARKSKALCFQQDEKQWGTAKAVASVHPKELKGDILIVSGDHPLVNSKDLNQFIEKYKSLNVDCAVGAFKQKEAGQYGQILLEKGYIKKIVEHYDRANGTFNLEEAALINTGLYLIKAETLNAHLDKISKNTNGEYNFTEILSLIYKNGGKAQPVPVPWAVAWGVNSQTELAVASQYVFNLKRDELMRKGVILVDATQVYVELEVEIGSGTIIYPGAYLKGQTRVGSFCAIEPHVFIADSFIGNFVNLRAGSYIEGAEIRERSVIGPYAHLRPQTRIGEECRVGNFVETKNLNMGKKSKAAHLSYLGDTDIGEEVNIGCGTVTCNYSPDKQKQKTVIKDGVFIGSGSQLIAPVTVESEAVVAAGSVITKNVPSGSLSISRSEQKNILDYKKKKASSKPSS